MALPVAELVVATFLLPRATAGAGACAAFALLVVFSAALGVNLARGRQPDCRCFGQLHSTPASSRTLVRNAALATLAAFVAWNGWRDAGTSALVLVQGLRITEIAALIVLTLSAGFGYELFRQHGRLLVRLDALEQSGSSGELATAPVEVAGIALGQPAPSFRLERLDGESATLESFLARGRPVLLLFTNPRCGPCRALMPEVEAWQREHGEALTISLVSEGSVEENREYAGEPRIDVLVQTDREVAAAYRVSGTPSAVVVGQDGRVASGVAPGAAAIRALVARAVDDRPFPPPAPHGGAEKGDAPPRELDTGVPVGVRVDFRSRNLEGDEVALADYRGRRILLIHWSPHCAFCQRIAPDLASLRPGLEREGTQLILASTDDREANRALAERHDLRAPILLLDGSPPDAFRQLGTPVGYLLDEHGKVAMPLAVGANEVDLLARHAAARTGPRRDGRREILMAHWFDGLAKWSVSSSRRGLIGTSATGPTRSLELLETGNGLVARLSRRRLLGMAGAAFGVVALGGLRPGRAAARSLEDVLCGENPVGGKCFGTGNVFAGPGQHCCTSPSGCFFSCPEGETCCGEPYGCCAPDEVCDSTTDSTTPMCVACATTPPPAPLPGAGVAPRPRDPHIPGGGLCRDACGKECPDTCVPRPDVTICVADSTGRCHYAFQYSNVIECGTHEACRKHDRCLDACAQQGQGTKSCDTLCHFMCPNDYPTLDCISWKFGRGPRDGVLTFSDPPIRTGPIGGACP